VEAARAGEAGMGFAVVADEVRNLAQRSAHAAKETAAKIEGAITKTTQGVEISEKVAQRLNEIVTKSRQVDDLVAEVANATKEQNQGITQINTAVGQMDMVTQNNAANAEESASASEELYSQSESMKQSVEELLQLVGSNAGQPASRSMPVKDARPTIIKKSALYSGSQNENRNGHLNGNGHHPVAAKPNLESRRGEIPLAGDFRDF